MQILFRANFLLTLSDLFTNLSAGWFGAVLILPGIWASQDLKTNLMLTMINLFYGTACFLFSYYLKELNHAN